ncbi:hypothetical protein [Fibrobacter sp.]|uniref:hypothetical protein n=1 Tax=Fibrobacter sp. TaxID=35828 RepID=UPI00388EBBD3
MKINEYIPEEGWMSFNKRKANEVEVSAAEAILFVLLFVAFPLIYTIASFLDVV